MNAIKLLVLLSLLMCAGCRPPHAGRGPAQAELEKVLIQAAQNKSVTIQIRRTDGNRTNDGTELWCMQGDFKIQFVDDLLGEYTFLVTYPNTGSRVQAFVFEDGWLFRSYTLVAVSSCEIE